MISTASLSASELLAELTAEAIKPHAGNVGVLVRDVLPPDAERLLSELKTFHENEQEIRVAYLDPASAPAAKKVGLDKSTFSTEVEQAEKWRNDRELEALIVVFARGDEAKLSSLEDFGSVTSRDLKRVLVERALGGPAGENEVQSRWWGMLARDDGVGLGQLIDYYLALAGKAGNEFSEAASRQVHRLGLLPDPALFNDPKPQALKRRLQDNRDLVRRLQTLTPRDRRMITKRLNEETDDDEKAKLREAFDQLHRTRWKGKGMESITFESAERLVKARTKKPKSSKPKPGETSKPATEKVVAIAAEALVDPDREDELKAVVQGLQDRLNSLDESSLRKEKIAIPLPGSATEAVTFARGDVINPIAKALDDGVYGGLLEAEPGDLEDILRRFEPQQHLIARWERERIEEALEHVSVDDAGHAIGDAFRAYDKARAGVIPLSRTLEADPLAVASHGPTRKTLLDYIAAYEGINEVIRTHYDHLFEVFGSDIDELLGLLLLLETIVIKTDDQVYAIAAPTHPLFLWHYAKYCDIVESQRDRLDEGDRALVVEAAAELPNFLTSLFIPSSAYGEGALLTYAGRLGALPYFAEHAEASASDDGIKSLGTLIEAFLALEPHAELGLRLALVDPPDAGVYLSTLTDLAERGKLFGAHVVAYRHPKKKAGVELRLDEAEEERVARVFKSLTLDRRFTFESRELAHGAVGPPANDAFHLVVVFDRSGGRPSRARPAAHPIQPLALPRRIHYSQFYKTVELEPAPGGPFDSYDKVVGRLSKGGQASYLSVHQDQKLRSALTALAERATWTAVADRQVDRDLAIGALRVLTASEGDRDVAAFARSTASFRRALRGVATEYNTFITADELDDLLRQLSELLDAGLLSLRPDLTGKANRNAIKGLLGTLIAARWYRQSASGNRLLVSLDSPDARRWLRLAPDPLRADLVGLEWTGDHCTVTVMEVKAVDAPGAEYKIEEGVVTGSAIDQMLATRRLLGAVLAKDRSDELITTPARREILREHLYRELTKGSYPPEERKLWAERVQRLLDGKIDVDMRCHMIDVRLGADKATLEERSAVATDGEDSVPVQITELNEVLIESLQQQEPPEDQGEPDDGGEPPPEPEPDTGSGGDDTAEPEETPDIEVVTPIEDSTAEEEETKTAPSTPSKPPVERPRALLGVAPGTYGQSREVWFDPALPTEKLPNPHLSITGETGSGKTQATKAILADLRDYEIPSLILDFKDDYSDAAYAEAEGFRVYDATYETLPFNPLTPAIDQRTRRINPMNHIHQLTDITKRIYGLGDQQAYRLREAIKKAYDAAGVPSKPFEANSQVFPAFDAVKTHLESQKGNDALLGRMSPIFDLDLFAASEEDLDFDEFVATSTVVRLGQLPGDETKNSVAEFFLMALYNYLVRQPQTHTLGRVLVLDEAWRLVQSPFLSPLMREGRAFGLGVIIASQFPKDLPEAVRGSTATRLFFSQTQVEQIREIQRTIIGKTSGGEADHLAGVVRGLAPLSAVMHNKQYSPFVRVTLTPYFERRSRADGA